MISFSYTGIANEMLQFHYSKNVLVQAKITCSSSGSQDALSEEKCRMWQRKRSGVGKSLKQASSSWKEKSLELLANKRTPRPDLEITAFKEVHCGGAHPAGESDQLSSDPHLPFG